MMMTPNEFLAYIDYFNSRRYDTYYTDGVVVQLPTQQLCGKDEVKAFYGEMARHIHETVRVRKVFIEEDSICANIWSDFYCIAETDRYLSRAMKQGELLRLELVVLYTIRDGRFSHIRAGRMPIA
jgi:hypothetical protein